ncbi:hypothetical protein D9754_05875 [Planomicrobium sp. Y74]|nr:hypothetical protein D9754_05875 [Planomicrobium sp. Y74]
MLYASHGSEEALKSYVLDNDKGEAFEIPELGEDGIVFISVNPADDQQIAVYTVQGDAYVSSDEETSWTMILEKGQIQ